MRTDRFTAAQALDTQQAAAHLVGEPMFGPLYHAVLVPTYAGAMRLTEILGIERVREDFTTTIGSDGALTYHGIVWARLDGTIRCGAASGDRADVALRLAYRNAVRALATRRTEWE